MAEVRECRTSDIFKLGGNVYTFDSATIEFCIVDFHVRRLTYLGNDAAGE